MSEPGLPAVNPGQDWVIHSDYDRTTVNLVSVTMSGNTAGIIESHTFKHREQFIDPHNVTPEEYMEACVGAAEAVLHRVHKRIHYAQLADQLMRKHRQENL